MTNNDLAALTQYFREMNRIIAVDRHDKRVTNFGYNAGETAYRMDRRIIRVLLSDAQRDMITKAGKMGWSISGAWSEPVEEGDAKVLVILEVPGQAAGILPCGKMVRAPLKRKTFDVPSNWWSK